MKKFLCVVLVLAAVILGIYIYQGGALCYGRTCLVRPLYGCYGGLCVDPPAEYFQR
jgi:hypothetical protein